MESREIKGLEIAAKLKLVRKGNTGKPKAPRDWATTVRATAAAAVGGGCVGVIGGVG